jgi:hypothetical protein
MAAKGDGHVTTNFVELTECDEITNGNLKTLAPFEVFLTSEETNSFALTANLMKHNLDNIHC